MSEFEHGPSDDYRRRANAEAEELFLDRQACLQEHGGVIAIDDELVGDGIIGPGPKLWVKVTRVALAGNDGSAVRLPFDRNPILRFVVSDKEHLPQHSFAVERDAAVEALRLAHPENAALRHPVSAFVDEAVAPGIIRAGEERLLAMSGVTLSPDGDFRRGAGVRFEVSDKHKHPLFNFSIDWPLAFLLVNAAYPEHG